MKAVTWRAYGPPEVLRVEELPEPVPGENHVLVRVRATTVTAADAMLRRGGSAAVRMIVGLREPRRRYRVPGLELAGVVESTGRRVTRFRPGDEVYGFTGFRLGACAEYACLPERSSLAIKPSTVTYGEAAALVDGATTALYFLQDKAHLRSGQRVLVLGASGSIGGYAVQLARHFGAEVAATCSTSNLELVRSLGAHRAIDYTTEDLGTSAERYDVIFDAVGASSFSRSKRSLTARGCYLTTVMGLTPIAQTLATWASPRRRVRFGMSVQKTEALRQLKDLVDDGAVTPVVDRCFALEQIVDAHRYVDRGHKRGNVVVNVGGDPSGRLPEAEPRTTTEPRP
jgi:NADPH:quinone reductase-like Zn-dependent oxidoreductase